MAQPISPAAASLGSKRYCRSNSWPEL
jgi:hypothetical protein